MKAKDIRPLGAEGYAESYISLRNSLIVEAEKRHAAIQESEQANEWRKNCPSTGQEYLLRTLALDREQIDFWSKEKGEAYRKHYAEVVEPRLTETQSHKHLPFRDDLGSSDPRIDHPIPYAMLFIASDETLLGEIPDGVELHHSLFWYELQNNWSQCKSFFIDHWGEGNGLVGFFPAYDNSDWVEVYWVFQYDPPSSSLWSCSSQMHFEGSIHCWANDAWYESLYARIFLYSRLSVRPMFGWGVGYQETEKTVFDYSGQNIDIAVSGGCWDNDLGPLSPNPYYVSQPHWVVVSVEGQARWRGCSHVMLNFSKGCLINPYMPFGAYCMSTTVFNPLAPKVVWPF